MGRLGKDKNPLVRLSATALLLVLASCAARDGRYAGSVIAEDGVCNPGAGGKQSVGSLLLRGNEALFAPEEGVLLLRGRFDAKTGHVTASTTTPGADHKPFLMVFEGDLRDGHVEGRYATPRCRAAVRLDRAG